MMCTNRDLPTKLRPGDINHATNDAPSAFSYRSIGTPSAPIEPPIGDEVHWRLLAHMTLNLRRLAERESLCTALSLYDFRSRTDRQARPAARQSADRHLRREGRTPRRTDRRSPGQRFRGAFEHRRTNGRWRRRGVSARHDPEPAARAVRVSQFVLAPAHPLRRQQRVLSMAIPDRAQSHPLIAALHPVLRRLSQLRRATQPPDLAATPVLAHGHQRAAGWKPGPWCMTGATGRNPR